MSLQRKNPIFKEQVEGFAIHYLIYLLSFVKRLGPTAFYYYGDDIVQKTQF